MSVYCDEHAEVWNERRVKARKEHTCSACRETIRKGDRYIRDAMLFDGDWSVVLRCERCDLIFEHLQERMKNADEFPARELDCGHEYRERWEEDPPEWLAALAFWMPGDPLPATIPCTLLATWSHPPRWYSLACFGNVCSWRNGWPWQARDAGHCERRNNPAHTEPCS